jgi:hypothetical protein
MFQLVRARSLTDERLIRISCTQLHRGARLHLHILWITSLFIAVIRSAADVLRFVPVQTDLFALDARSFPYCTAHLRCYAFAALLRDIRSFPYRTAHLRCIAPAVRSLDTHRCVASQLKCALSIRIDALHRNCSALSRYASMLCIATAVSCALACIELHTRLH